MFISLQIHRLSIAILYPDNDKKNRKTKNSFPKGPPSLRSPYPWINLYSNSRIQLDASSGTAASPRLPSKGVSVRTKRNEFTSTIRRSFRGKVRPCKNVRNLFVWTEHASLAPLLIAIRRFLPFLRVPRHRDARRRIRITGRATLFHWTHFFFCYFFFFRTLVRSKFWFTAGNHRIPWMRNVIPWLFLFLSDPRRRLRSWSPISLTDRPDAGNFDFQSVEMDNERHHLLRDEIRRSERRQARNTVSKF